MAFVNEKLTKEEREEFAARKIKNPTINRMRGFLDPIDWTIDRENDMYLVHAGYDRDYLNEEYFVFFWKGEQHVISLIQESTGGTVIWKKEIQVSPYSFSVNDNFVDDLRSALRTFKVTGIPCERNENIGVIIDF